MPSRPVIVWFRDDLRLADHPAWAAAVASGRPVIALHVLDEVSPGVRPLGAAARWWLDRSLEALAAALGALGVPLVLRRGPAAIVIGDVIEATGAEAIHWNRRYGAEVAIDRDLKADLKRRGIEARSHHGNVLFEPPAVRTGSGGSYRVFTAFWRACLAAPAPRPPLAEPPHPLPFAGGIDGDRLADWGLRPRAPDWSSGLSESWTPGEAGARAALARFLDHGLADYTDDRDRPDLDGVSRLSPHLRFGEISPFAVWAAVRERVASAPRTAASAEKFLAEIGWREFAHHLLFHAPDMASRNLQPRFDALPWRDDPAFLAAWRRGRTGYPLVDAGLRQLWRTGWMHNRVRMVAASFLVKHGLVDWRAGEAWFWDTLVDACPANNPMGWQWVAGTGADAAPFFRIFNPVAQSEKFDPDGTYVRRWVPELAGLPTKALHAPWTVAPGVLAAAGVRLGQTYPRPVVEHGAARARALAAFERTARSP